MIWTQIDRARALSHHPERAQRHRALEILDDAAPRARELGMAGAIEHARRSLGALLR